MRNRISDAHGEELTRTRRIADGPDRHVMPGNLHPVGVTRSSRTAQPYRSIVRGILHREAVIRSSRTTYEPYLLIVRGVLHPIGVIKSSRGFERTSETKWRTERIPPDARPALTTLKGWQKAGKIRPMNGSVDLRASEPLWLTLKTAVYRLPFTVYAP